MKRWNMALLILAPVAGLSLAAASAHAAVFVCAGPEDCVNRAPITQAQYDRKSTDGESTSVRETLSNSANQSIKNGYESIGGTDLAITKFWHKGGTLPFDDTYEHVTLEVYKNGAYQKTCHAYSFRTSLVGPYQASCN